MTARAAGVMLLSDQGRVLFLRRSKSGDHPGQWCFPGGGIEGRETPISAAVRELAEECDVKARKRHLTFWTRRIADGVDFTTFVVRGVMEFDPVLNGEHTTFIWRDPKEPPHPLHPGCRIALDRIGMDELGVARAMRDGDLHGPQDYENIVLFNMRITGTGTAFRHKWGEFVQRDPALYLNDDFLARCNGLPVIMEHPKGHVLTSDEFSDRAIGTIMLPYIKGDEVWGIAKIYDATAAKMMKDEQLSTSPAVVWRDPDVNTRLETRDGESVLIEGPPSLLDHLAVCRVGVWDKGGLPEGIDTKGVIIMADDKKKPAVAADDAGDKGGTPLDRLLKGLDAMNAKFDTFGSRLDAIEQKQAKAVVKADADEPPAPAGSETPPPPPPGDGKPVPPAADAPDAAPPEAVKPPAAVAPPKTGGAAMDADRPPPFVKDPEDKKPDPAEAAAADSVGDLNALRKRLADVEKQLATRTSHDLAADQAAADSVYSLYGEQAPRPLIGDSRASYVLRHLEKFKVHSPAWKDVDLTPVSVDEKVLDIAASQIYAAARDAASNPANVPAGQLRAITTRTPTGHIETKFMGSPAAWMNRHAPNKRFVTAINLKKD